MSEPRAEERPAVPDADLEALQERFGPPQPRAPKPGQQALDLGPIATAPGPREQDGAKSSRSRTGGRRGGRRK